MLRLNIWKTIFIVLICLLSFYFSLPTLLSESHYKGFANYLPSNKVNLGLDLRGGASLTLEVNTDLYYKEQMNNVLSSLKKELTNDKIKYKTIKLMEYPHEKKYAITITSKKIDNEGNILDKDKLSDLKSRIFKILGNIVQSPDVSVDYTYNSDNQEKGKGKNDADMEDKEDYVVLKAEIPESVIDKMRKDVIAQSIEIIRKRIDDVGTREIDIQRQGENQILVQVPGVYNTAEIVRLIGQTAKLTFNLALPEYGNDPSKNHPLNVQFLPMRVSKNDGNSVDFNNDNDVSANKESSKKQTQKEQLVALDVRPAMSGDAIADAQASVQNGQHVVMLKLTNIGAKIFADLTMKNVGKPLAIVLDNEIISAPVITQPIVTGTSVISGNFDAKSSNELAVLLRAGALPAPLTVVEERMVGPTLGQDSIDAGTSAILVGGIMVMIFMLLFYGFWGLFANCALIINLLLIISVLSLLNATLTLPGLAGIALTIGMAVDANVLIYERIREEHMKGLSMLASIEAGYRGSFITIFDSNLTTVIVAAILYIFATGAIQGFAVTLIIGICSSLFTAIVVTKLLTTLWYRYVKPQKLWL